jgi:small multidrug resistance family-3 protein
VTVARSLILFIAAALAEIGGAWHFGRILAAYGGVFVAGSLAWGMVVDGLRPDGYDIVGALVCLIGVGVIMDAPRDA